MNEKALDGPARHAIIAVEASQQAEVRMPDSGSAPIGESGNGQERCGG